MSIKFSLSTGNEHFKQPTPQGKFLTELLKLVQPEKDVWYADTFSLPTFDNLVRYYSGTVILYCWWDPADDRITPFLDDLNLKFIIVTSDPELVPTHEKIQTIKWHKQYGYHMDLIKSEPWYELEYRNNFLCMMRNHKPERLLFLEELWRNDLINENLISYLGQVNTRAIHGRTSRPIEQIVSKQYQADTAFTYIPSSDFAVWLTNNIPILLPDDQTQTNEHNTDFFTIGNPDWYAWTCYSVILETYWARTQFLTEKTFKPIVAKHPFINLGNSSNALLKKLGFDTFEDVFGVEHDSLPAQEKIHAVIPKLTTVDIDPARCEFNYHCGLDLLSQAEQEQKQLAKQVVNIL
jgi:hypothetical protein